ncbi:hypothetical protein D3C80_1054440 [compost metagenome]
MIVVQRQNVAGRDRVVGACFFTVKIAEVIVAQIGTPVEVGKADIAQITAPQLGDRYKVFHFETVAIPLIFVCCVVVLPLVFRIHVQGQAHRQTGVDVSTQTHIPGALATRRVATHIVDIVVRDIPLFEWTEAQICACQLVDREARFDFHKQWRTVVPDTFRIGVTTEEYGRIQVTIEIKPVFLSESFIFQIGIVTDLWPKTSVVATHYVDALMPPVGNIFRFCVLCCVNSERRGKCQRCTGC